TSAAFSSWARQSRWSFYLAISRPIPPAPRFVHPGYRTHPERPAPANGDRGGRFRVVRGPPQVSGPDRMCSPPPSATKVTVRDETVTPHHHLTDTRGVKRALDYTGAMLRPVWIPSD